MRSTIFRLSTVVAAAIAASFTGGCSGGGTSTGTYTSPGSLVMTFSGLVEDRTGAILVGYTVTIDHGPLSTTDAKGAYTENVPTINVGPVSSIEVFDPNGRLAHQETRKISTAVCVQALAPIVVGPPVPP